MKNESKDFTKYLPNLLMSSNFFGSYHHNSSQGK